MGSGFITKVCGVWWSVRNGVAGRPVTLVRLAQGQFLSRHGEAVWNFFLLSGFGRAAREPDDKTPVFKVLDYEFLINCLSRLWFFGVSSKIF